MPLAAGHLVENHLTFAPAMPVDLEFGKAVAMGHGAESVPGVSMWHAPCENLRHNKADGI